MGKKYKKRYEMHFANPDICEFDMQHEQWLFGDNSWTGRLLHVHAGIEGSCPMENRTPQRDKAVRTRQRLLEATLAQTAACGYHNITVDKIAAAAGVSTGSAYRYFRNKKEMLLAALAYHYENIQDFFGTPDSSLRSFSSPEDMLAYVLGQFYGLHRNIMPSTRN